SMPARAPGYGDHSLSEVFAVLILEIIDVLSDDRRRLSISTHQSIEFENERIEVAIVELLRSVVHRPACRLQTVLLDFHLHPLDHCERFLPGAELGGTDRRREDHQHQRTDESDCSEAHRIPPATGHTLRSVKR